MAATLKYQGQSTDKGRRITTETDVWQGTKEEMVTLMTTTYAPGTTVTGRGVVKNAKVSQDVGGIWNCTVTIQAGGSAGAVNSEPYTTVGEKSCVLSGTMLSLPIESHPDYKACWTYNLAVLVTPLTETLPSAPNWWATATTTILTVEQSKEYCWYKDSLSECPAVTGKKWEKLCARLEKADSFGFPTYTITEKGRYNTATAAGNAIAKVLGKRGGTPSETFGVTGGREWLCEDAQVQWGGDGWYSSLTWTLSGDTNGWSQRLYASVV